MPFRISYSIQLYSILIIIQRSVALLATFFGEKNETCQHCAPHEQIANGQTLSPIKYSIHSLAYGEGAPCTCTARSRNGTDSGLVRKRPPPP